MRWFIAIAFLSLAVPTAASALDGGKSMVDLPATVMSEDFEGSWPPAGWTILHAGDTHTWEPTSAQSHSGDTSAWVQYGAVGTVQDEWLVSGPVDLSGLPAASFEFYEAGAFWDSWGDHHYIMVSTTSQTDMGSFVVALDMRPGVHEIGTFDGPPVRTDLTPFLGEPEVYIAFRYTGSFSDHWFVDDCRVFEPFQHDVAVLDVGPDDRHYAPGENVTPVVRIENTGLSVEASVRISLEIRESGAVVRNDTTASLGVGPGDVLVRNFPYFTVAEGHWYEIEATAFVPGDGDPANDTASGLIDTYTRPRTPLGMLLTNNNSPDCVQAETALDAYMAGQDDGAALVRVHVAWPAPDAVFTAAPEPNGYLARALGGRVIPHLRLDGTTDAGADGVQYADLFEARKSAGSPMDMTLAWDPALQQAVVRVANIDPIPGAADLRLRVAVTEDGVDALGDNGLRYHDQALRGLYPDTTGAAVPAVGGLHRYAVPCPLDPAWDLDRLRCTAWVQDERDGRVLQAVTDRLADMEISVGVDPARTPRPPTLDSVTPNPFNPSTRIAFTLSGDGPARVTVHDLGGRLVRTLLDEALPAGGHAVAWDGRHRDGRAAGSGSYICRIVAADGAASRRLTLLR